jgi:hypothetical protein
MATRREDSPARYAGTRARVEARVALEQAEELWRVLDELGERLGEWGQGEGHSPCRSLPGYALLPSSGRAVIQV